MQKPVPAVLAAVLLCVLAIPASTSRAGGTMGFFEIIRGASLSFTPDEVTVRVTVEHLIDHAPSFEAGETIHAWIDWDGDGRFEPEERVMRAFGVPIDANGNVILIATYQRTAPIRAASGGLPLWMRVILSQGDVDVEVPVPVDLPGFFPPRDGPGGIDVKILDSRILRVNGVEPAPGAQVPVRTRGAWTIDPIVVEGEILNPFGFPLQEHRVGIWSAGVMASMQAVSCGEGTWACVLPPGAYLDPGEESHLVRSLLGGAGVRGGPGAEIVSLDVGSIGGAREKDASGPIVVEMEAVVIE